MDTRCVLQRAIRAVFRKAEERVEAVTIVVVNWNVSYKFVP